MDDGGGAGAHWAVLSLYSPISFTIVLSSEFDNELCFFKRLFLVLRVVGFDSSGKAILPCYWSFDTGKRIGAW